MTQRKFVYVKWRDAHDLGSGTWIPTPQKPSVGMLIESVGLVVYEDRRHLVITHSRASDGDTRGAFAILKSTIVKRRRLK